MQSNSSDSFCETANRNRPLSVYSLSNDKDFDIRVIIEGDLNHLPPLPSRTIRVFLSSTFSDMIPERNALMEHVYPQLKNFCRQQYRLEFQMIDLRWGIREQSHDDHTIIDFCLKEIENCKKVSLGPSFVVLIGQKYGYRPFPPTINAREFETIRDELVASGHDVDLLDRWFKRNTNVTSAVYNLQPISSILPNYANKSDETLQQSANEEWARVHKSLQHLLRSGVQSCVESGKLSEVNKDKYFISVTEYEIEKGMLEVEDACQNCLCFVRDITNLEINCTHPEARKYLDIVDGSDIVDVEAQNLLAVLQNEKISKVLKDERNLEYFQTAWTDTERHAPSADPVYLSEFCNIFRDKMQWMINRAAQRLRSISCHQRLVEILQHLTMCRSRSEAFKGREDTLKRIRLYMCSSSRTPVVLYGESGSGKTSVVAKVASLVLLWFDLEGKSAKPVVIVRFLGTTSHSCSIRLVLGGICWQIASAYGRDKDTIPSDYPGLVAYFKDILNVANPDRPLVILLDGLDQLCPDHRAYGLAWLPSLLPPNVYLVLSTLPCRHELLDTLAALYPDRNSFMNILSLGPQLSINLVKEWLHSAGRDLTSAQYDVVENALSACNLPLYTTLVFQEVCRWFSYSTPDQTVLEPTVTRIINTLFDRIERYHGHVFVSHALSYLTASKNGLSEGELEDLLSLDDVVLNDVFQHWLPPLRRIPPLLLPRLQDELSSYITQREANETVVFYWYHGQFISAAKERYLSDPSHKVFTHSILAQYFLGTWGEGKKKSFRYSVKQLRWLKLKTKESKADRKVSGQPLHFGHDSHHPSSLNYNLRKLSELPYHLLESQMVRELMSQVLFNYDWLHAKLTAMSLHDVLSDFNLAISGGIRNSDIWLLAGALRVGGNHVNQNPDTLAFDLIGRLLQYYDAGGEFQHLTQLLQHCDTRSLKDSAVIPILQCFDPPTAELLYVLEGHSQVASDIVFSATTNELISVSKDGTIAFWDLSTGERSRTIDVARLQPGRKTRLFQSSDGKYLIVDYDTVDSPIEIYETKTGQLLHSCGARLPSLSRGFLAGSLYCRQKTILDIRTGQVVQTIDAFVNSKAYVTCAISPNDKLLVVGDAGDMKLFDVSTGELLTTNNEGKLLSVLAMTPDSRRCYAGYAIDCLFRVFDSEPGSSTIGQTLMKYDCNQALTHLSKVAVRNEQRFPRELSELSVSPACQDLVLINFRRFRLILLNVADSATMVMDVPLNSDCATPQAIMSSTFNFDGKLALAIDENYLHVWSTETANLLNSINIHSTPNFPLAVCRNRNLVATGSTIHTAIKVWNLDRAQRQEMQLAKVYESPVDCVACAPENGLIFVKNYYGLASSNKGYKYHDSFGIDVWNLATGLCRPFLNFKKYGKLLKMIVSPDGDQLALLLNAINIWYVVILCDGGQKIRCVASHRPDYSCNSFIVSPNWKHMTTCVSHVGETTRLVVLWDLCKGVEVICFEDAVSPVFSFDGQNLFYVYKRELVICYDLKTLAPAFKISEKADRLQAIPARRGSILLTRFASKYASTISVWNFQEVENSPKIIIRSSSPTGIQDISKDGKLAVDGYLQVFDLETGILVVRLGTCPPTVELNTVRMTYDGKYVVWVESVSVKVGRVLDGAIIGNTSTHERTTCLHTMNFGYVLVLGREDGHLLTMKLIDQTNERIVYTPENSQDRRQLLLSIDVCPPEVRRLFDGCYQEEHLQPMSDSDIPQVDERVSSQLIDYAYVPHTVISTSEPSADQPAAADDNDTGLHTPRKRSSQTSGGSPLCERAFARSVGRGESNDRSSTPSPDRHIKGGHCTSTTSLTSSNGASGSRGSTMPRLGQDAKRSSSEKDLYRLHITCSADSSAASGSKSGKLNLAHELSKLIGRSNKDKNHQKRGSKMILQKFFSRKTNDDLHKCKTSE